MNPRLIRDLAAAAILLKPKGLDHACRKGYNWFMASQQRTVDFLVEQTARAGVVTARKMFGEYALYCDGKLVALVCDDQLFIKPTPAGRAHAGDVAEAPPYPGAKPNLLIEGDRWDDRDWLAQLVRITADALPAPTPKKRKAK